MNYLDDIEKIHQFINGQLKGQELADFEEQLKRDLRLAEEVALQRDLLLSVDAFGDQELEDTISQVSHNLDEEGFFLAEEQLHAYLADAADPALKKKIAQRSATDPEFYEELKLEEEMLKSIQYFGEQEERMVIKGVQEKLQKEGFFEEAKVVEIPKRRERPIGSAPVKPRGWVREIFIDPRRVIQAYAVRMAVAATILLLLMVGTYLNFSTNPYSKAFATYYEPEQTEVSALVNRLGMSAFGTDKARNESLKSALGLYRSGQYPNAVESLRSHILVYPQDTVALFYLGVSLLENKDYSEASQVFERVMELGPSSSYDEAQWYQALSFLMIKNKRETALPLLEEIAKDQKSPHNDEAQKILEELK